MALKGDRNLVITEVGFFMNQEAEAGGVAVYKTAGSGAALDQQDAEVEYAASPSGKTPVGLVLTPMVDKDLTRTHLSFQRPEMQKGSKIPLLRDGWVVTDMLEGTGVVPVGTEKAYLGVSGLLTTEATGTGGFSNPEVGRFESSRDEDGYVKVYVKLPR